MSGLALLSQKIDAKLRVANSTKQRAASLVACEFALAEASVEAPIVTMALAALRTGEVFSPSLKAQLDSLAEQLDDQYLELKDAAEAESADPNQWQDMFAKARAVTALSNAGGGHPYEAAGESIYEAAFTIRHDDKQELLSLVEAALE